MAISNKQKAVSLLKSLETGNSEPLQFINPNKLIQHNLSFEDGLDGLKKLIQGLPKSTKVNTVRVFEDGEFVFAHTEYDFFGPKIGFGLLGPPRNFTTLSPKNKGQRKEQAGAGHR